MVEDNNRETGARKFPARHGPDPRDAFSQKAAENKPPKDGMGLTENVDHGDGQQPARSPAAETIIAAEPEIIDGSKDGSLPDGGHPPSLTQD